MGLNFMVGDEMSDAQWSYGGFMRFREKVAKEIGINLLEMDGFKHEGWPRQRMKGILWKMEDPIELLLNHSDCDGRLSAKQCAKVWPRLAELIKGWPDSDYDKKSGMALVESMRGCVEKNKSLRFC